MGGGGVVSESYLQPLVKRNLGLEEWSQHEHEKGLVMGSTFIDLTKAFDTVNHDI